MPSTRPQPVLATLGPHGRWPETKWTVNRMAGLSLAAAWCMATLVSFMIDPAMAPRFLDMPLGAFLAGQGALVGLVIIGVRITRAGNTDIDD